GIPAPIYFGAIIDTTCLKWGRKRCGGKGACRIYDTTAYRCMCSAVRTRHIRVGEDTDGYPPPPLRIVYLGLTLGLRTASFFLCALGFVLLRRHVRREEKSSLANGGTEIESLTKEENSSLNCDQFVRNSDCDPDRETRL
ncbi:hypothetical protein Z043_105993, partial [Scleropages formosus]